MQVEHKCEFCARCACGFPVELLGKWEWRCACGAKGYAKSEEAALRACNAHVARVRVPESRDGRSKS